MNENEALMGPIFEPRIFSPYTLGPSSALIVNDVIKQTDLTLQSVRKND